MPALYQGSAPGIYHGVVERARYHNGVIWARLWIPAWSSPPKKYITRWARVAIPWGTYNFGTWGSLHQGEHVWVAFEEGDPEKPVVIGHCPMPQDEGKTEMPPEFVNDDYADKTPHTGIREDPPEEDPINPAWIAKSPLWGQYFLLHDKLKRAVVRVADVGGGECPNLPGQEKPAIELGELATHNVLLGDLFMELYNNHKHKDVVKGGEESGPPTDDSLMTCEKHLSHVVYVIRDPWDQPPSPLVQRMVDTGKKALAAASRGGAGGGEGVDLADVMQAAVDFCSDPGKFVEGIAKNAGVPQWLIDAGKGLLGGFVDGFIKGATDLLGSVGIEVPSLDSLCGAVQALADGDLLEVGKRLLPAALGIAGIPPGVTKAVLDVTDAILDVGGDIGAAAKAAADAFGAEGLAALGGIMAGGLF